MSFEDVVASARRELLDPTFAITKQILDVHSVVMQDNEPHVAAVHHPANSDHAFVFFDIIGEPYHVWVRVGVEDGNVQFAGIAPLTRVELVVTSVDQTPADIEHLLGTTATQVYRRGDLPPRGAQPYRTNVWIYEPEPRGAGFFEQRLRGFAEAVRPLQDRVRQLPAGCEVEVSIISEQCAAWPEGFHVPADVAANLSALGGSIDIDVYFSGPGSLGE